MRNLNAFHSRCLIILVMILIFGSGSYFTHRTWSSSNRGTDDPSQPLKPLRIANWTSAFDVVDIVRHGQRVRLTLKNNYSRNIAAFSLSLGDYSIEPDFFPRSLAPGETHVEPCTLPPTDKSESLVELRAVMFEDEGGEGDLTRVRRIREYRFGKQLAAKAMYPHLRRVSDALDNNLLSTLHEAKFAIVNLPTPKETEVSEDVWAGFITGKNYVLSDFEDIGVEIRNGCDGTCVRRRLKSIKEREWRKTVGSTR